jgi:hypothetical protein
MGRSIAAERADLFYSCAQRKAFSTEAIENQTLEWLEERERTAGPTSSWTIYLTVTATTDERADIARFLEAEC